jgi:hypothetical protein
MRGPCSRSSTIRTSYASLDSHDMTSALTTQQQHHQGYANGPQAIWSLFCNGQPVGTASNSAWCFDAATNMSYARYSTTDRWRWVGGCVHEHVSSCCSLGKSGVLTVTVGHGRKNSVRGQMLQAQHYHFIVNGGCALRGGQRQWFVERPWPNTLVYHSCTKA